MNARSTRLIAASIVVLSLAAVPFVYAGPHGRRGGELGALGALLHARAELDLSDAQVTSIKAIFRDLREQNAPHREQLRGGRDSIIETLLANPNDVAVAQAQLDRHAAAEKAMKTNVLTAAAKALNVLTPAQRVKLAEMRGEHRERRSGIRQRGSRR
jgi:Spy/CpxP family protein refolding chaperone